MKRHAGSINHEVVRMYIAHFFQQVVHVVDGFVSGREPVVIKSSYAPDKTKRIQQLMVVSKNKNLAN